MSRPADGRCQVARCRRALPPEEHRSDLTYGTDICSRCARIVLRLLERQAGAAGPAPSRPSLPHERTRRGLPCMLKAITRGVRGPAALEEHAIRGQSIRILLEAVQFLPERCRRVLVLRFGLDGEGRRTLRHAGALIGLKRERVRQLEAEGLGLLRVMVEGVL